MAKLVVVEAFYGGSHKQLLDTILKNIDPNDYDLFTLPAKKWHWKARLSALYFAQTIPHDRQYAILFTSSVMNIAELIGMRPDLSSCRKIVYFHENQLIYPVQEVKHRDCQYGLNQIMTCLSADCILFNSHFNQTSFLENINTFLNIQGDIKLKNIRKQVEPKCEVVYFPIDFDRMPVRDGRTDANVLHLIWPHRWEHDKNPQLFADALTELCNRDVPFKASIIGEQFEERPECLDTIRETLGDRIIHFGFLKRDEYFQCLLSGDIVISTANHEFYGVSMLEAVHCGCMPLAPNRLVYPEIYPKNSLFNTSAQLVKMLSNWCSKPTLFRKHRDEFFRCFDFRPYSSQALLPLYLSRLSPRSAEALTTHSTSSTNH